MWVQSLGWEDPLEEGMATHFSILAWRIPWTEEPGGLWSKWLQKVRRKWSNLAQHSPGQGLTPSQTQALLCSVVQGRGTRWEQVEKMDYPGITRKSLPFAHRMQAEQSHSRHLVYPTVYWKRTGPYSCPSEKHSHTLTIFLKNNMFATSFIY